MASGKPIKCEGSIKAEHQHLVCFCLHSTPCIFWLSGQPVNQSPGIWSWHRMVSHWIHAYPITIWFCSELTPPLNECWYHQMPNQSLVLELLAKGVHTDLHVHVNQHNHHRQSQATVLKRIWMVQRLTGASALLSLWHPWSLAMPEVVPKQTKGNVPCTHSTPKWQHQIETTNAN